jgi:Fe-S-cluster formation regulator IscX/YfhJ
MPEPDPRTVRLVELRAQVAAILRELRGLEPGSPKQLEALERFEPVHAAVLALAEVLGA